MNSRIGFFFLVLWVSPLLMAQSEEWKKIREKEGIEVYTRSNENMAFKEFRSEMTSDGTLDDFLSVLYDVEGLASWGYKVKSATLLSKDSDSLQVYYAVAGAPFPYKDRDGVYLNRFVWKPDKKILRVEIELLNDRMEEKEDLVRMQGYGFWEVVQRPDGRLDVVFQMQMDPGGAIPAWLSNMFSGDTPYFTMIGLREAMKEKKYRGKQHSLLR